MLSGSAVLILSGFDPVAGSLHKHLLIVKRHKKRGPPLAQNYLYVKELNAIIRLSS